MRICVYGAGSVGGFLAARLAKAGRSVSVIARGAHLDAIREHGLHLVTPDADFTVAVEASDRPAALGPQDLVIVTAKHPALAGIAAAIGPLLGPRTPVVFAMNGVFWFYGHRFEPGGKPLDLSLLDPSGALHREIGPERALGMVIFSPNEVTAPGVIHNGRTNNRFILGEAHGGLTERARSVHAALAVEGYALDLVPDIRPAMWGKLCLNASGSPLGSLTQARGDQIVADPDLRRVARALIQETMAVAAAHGFDDLGIDIEAQLEPGGRPAHRTSMLQDLLLGRPMEVDSIVGIVQKLGHQAGIATPVLDVVLPILRMRARIAASPG
jgi:2-dehydropantoate 2-reductase